jgi:hypothetical protein
VDDEDFEHLGKDEVLARIAAADGASAPLTMTTSEPADAARPDVRHAREPVDRNDAPPSASTPVLGGGVGTMGRPGEQQPTRHPRP